MGPLEGNVTLSNFILVWVRVPFKLISIIILKKYATVHPEIVIKKKMKLTAPGMTPKGLCHIKDILSFNDPLLGKFTLPSTILILVRLC